MDSVFELGFEEVDFEATVFGISFGAGFFAAGAGFLAMGFFVGAAFLTNFGAGFFAAVFTGAFLAMGLADFFAVGLAMNRLPPED